MVTYLKYQCCNCGKEFKRSLSGQNKNSKRHFCSQSCFKEFINSKKEVTCCLCGEKYLLPANKRDGVKKHYCRNCRKSIAVKCDVCGKEFKIYNSKARMFKGHFCSTQCKARSQRKDWNSLNRKSLKTRWISEFGKDSLYCRRCGHDKGYNIEIHHKIYVINGGNNDPNNLEPLCKNCHGTEHYENGNDDKE
jgi:endogenous inhibitor of DNA gyrase (YacG/DUF329 family)